MAETIKKLKEKLQKLPFAFRLFLLITLLVLASIFGALRFPPPVIEPVTPPVGVVSLLPSSSDNPAYYGTSSSAETNPSFAVSEFTDWDYGAVQSDNGKYANDTESASNGGYASVAHRFTFDVSGYNVQNFTIRWNGYYSFSGVGALNRKDIMIKNQTSGAWIDIGDMSTSDSDFTYGVSQEDTADFISSSGLIEFGVLLVGRAQTGFPPKSITIKVYSDMAELQIEEADVPVCNYYRPENRSIVDYNSTVSFVSNWTTPSGLSMGRFGWNASGTFTWDDWQDVWSGEPTNGWFNLTKKVPSELSGAYVKWVIQVNNTAGHYASVTGWFYVWEKFPAAFEHDLGRGTINPRYPGFYYNGTAAGGKEAIYVVYLNTTAEGEKWYIMVKAFDLETFQWVGPYIINSTPPDTHWLPSLGYLPDGRLIVAYAYYTGLKFRISTYSIKTESNLTKIMTNWESERELYVWNPISSEHYFAYPVFAMFNDTTIVFGRGGHTSNNFWTYYRWLDYGNLTFYARASRSITTSPGTCELVGNSPYFHEETFSYVNFYGDPAWDYLFDGEFYVNVSRTDGYFEQFGHVYFAFEYKGVKATSDDTLTVWLYVWNGSQWSPRYTKYFSLDTNGQFVWAAINISDWINTQEEFESCSFHIDALSGRGNLTVRTVAAFVTGKGFQPNVYFVTNVNGTSKFYLNRIYQTSNGEIILYGWDYNNPNNVLIVCSDDKGYTWKKVDGTIINHIPILQEDIREFTANEIRNLVVDENLNKPIVAIKEDLTDRSRLKLAIWNTTLFSSGKWEYYYPTRLDGSYFETYLGTLFRWKLVYNRYYKRIGFWSAYYNGDIGFYIASPWNITQFKEVYKFNDTTVRCDFIIPIFNAPFGYETLIEQWYFVLGKIEKGPSSLSTSKGTIYASRYTANMTGYLDGVRVWIDWSSSGIDVYGKAAVYNSTLHKIAESDQVRVVSQGEIHGFHYTITFSNPPLLTQGEQYYIAVQFDYNGVVLRYSDGNANDSFTCSTTWPNFPDSITSPTYGTKIITMYGIEMHCIIRGFGIDAFPPNPTQIGPQTALVGSTVTFRAFWTDNNELKMAQFYWNVTGNMELNGTIELSGKTAWSNFTRTIPSTLSPPATIAWYIVGIDVYWNTGNTSTQYLQVLFYTSLQAGWNNFSAWTVDVGHTLSQVNMSLALDNVNWTVISLEYSNGTRAVLVWEQSTGEYIGDENATVESGCTFYIYCLEAGKWYHEYP